MYGWVWTRCLWMEWWSSVNTSWVLSARTFIRHLWEGVKVSTLHVTHFASFCSIYSKWHKERTHILVLTSSSNAVTLSPFQIYTNPYLALSIWILSFWIILRWILNRTTLQEKVTCASLSFSATAVACACALEGNLWETSKNIRVFKWLLVTLVPSCSRVMVVHPQHVLL